MDREGLSKLNTKRKNNMKIKTIVVACLVCAYYSAVAEHAQWLSEKESAAIKGFFEDFREAFNAKDVERVKKMSGNTWNHWSKAINEGRFESVEILDITVGNQTNVIAKCVAVDSKNRTYPAEVVFTMKQEDGVYSIEKMRFPESERRSKELDKGMGAIEKLIEAINKRDLDSVKGLVSFGDADDFEAELSSRGLSWIKESIDNGVKAPKFNMSTSRDGRDTITGRLYVPCEPGGTNIKRKVVFKDGKIDRAAPREETKEEFLRRFEKENAERRRQFEKERAERERKQNEESLKHLQKWMK